MRAPGVARGTWRAPEAVVLAQALGGGAAGGTFAPAAVTPGHETSLSLAQLAVCFQVTFLGRGDVGEIVAVGGASTMLLARACVGLYGVPPREVVAGAILAAE